MIVTGSKCPWSFEVSASCLLFSDFSSDCRNLSPSLPWQRQGWQESLERSSHLPLPLLVSSASPRTPCQARALHKGALHSAPGCFVPGGPAPIQGPFWALFPLLFKRPQGGLSAQSLGSQVTSQRPCCPIEWHVESWGEREEDIINHEL